MCTGRSLTVCRSRKKNEKKIFFLEGWSGFQGGVVSGPGGVSVSWRGVCSRKGVSGPRGVSGPGGCLALGCVWSGWVVCSGGVLLSGVSALGGCLLRGCGIPVCTEADTPLWTESQMPVKKHYLGPTSLRPVIRHLTRNWNLGLLA